MRNTIWNKHIPTLLAISIIVIGITTTSYLVKSETIFVGQAGPLETPVALKISNISDTSFTVSYSTEAEVIGSVNFGKDKNLGSVAFDYKDQKSGSVSSYKDHSIIVKDLTPVTQYFFSISSGQNVFLNNTDPFDVVTAPALKTQPTDQISLSGKVVLPGGEKVSGGIVYTTIENAQIISTMISEDGSYTLPLGSMRINDLSSYFNFEENAIVKILIESGGFKSNVSVLASQKTVPTVTLPYDYDFTVSAVPVASQSGELIGFPSIQAVEEQGSTNVSTPQIVLPKKDQAFSDQQPQFKGIALPNETVTVIIHSEENIEAQIATDANGNWKFRPETALSPGEHTITIITRDAFGILRSITQSFTVYAQGTQVNQSATPSATPTFAFPTRTPTPTPIKTSTPTPTPGIGGPVQTPTPTPTTGLSASPTPTPVIIAQNLTPTPTPTPTLCPGCPSPTPTSSIANVTPTATIAPPGDSSTLTVGILGLAVAAIGGLLFLLTRAGI